MLKIKIPRQEVFNESNNSFITIPETNLQLEHSLVSISKWESKWRKSFLSTSVKKTDEEVIDYIRCMNLTQNIDPIIFNFIPASEVNKITEYINAPMTATTINNPNKKKSREIITSEIIYYWMISLGIPFECQKWHINRLLTLIEVCSLKNAPSKKMSRAELMSKNKALNAARRSRLGSRG